MYNCQKCKYHLKSTAEEPCLTCSDNEGKNTPGSNFEGKDICKTDDVE